ncbi:MAG: dihydrofolate reductase [Actinophytocola sp.]|uniref:dihydrofolate reductase family protein n=1 Tax=Actinophytocola sp. TaxID=1872138 RepID=UPI001327B266|nr:dihydrofolate reductase family protein [Actinophytocola sp.]MPZ83059.1 dihydrofolate reductase [Actinophytocola sp.]
MRKLIVNTLVTLDGVYGDPRSWAGPYFDEEAAESSLALLRDSDAMVMGRVTYEYFAETWPADTGPYADRVNGIRKYVFSSTLTAVEWTNSTLVSDDPVGSVARLKSEGDGYLVMYGFGQLARTLLAHDLVDEVGFWVFPLLIGDGVPLFRLAPATHLRLRSAQARSSGVVSLSYARADPA